MTRTRLGIFLLSLRSTCLYLRTLEQNVAPDVPNRGIHQLTRGKVKPLFFPRLKFFRRLVIDRGWKSASGTIYLRYLLKRRCRTHSRNVCLLIAYSCFDKDSHERIKAYATMPIGIMGRRVWRWLIEVHGVYQQEKATREGINTFVCAIFLYVAETPKASIKDQEPPLLMILDSVGCNIGMVWGVACR